MPCHSKATPYAQQPTMGLLTWVPATPDTPLVKGQNHSWVPSPASSCGHGLKR